MARVAQVVVVEVAVAMGATEAEMAEAGATEAEMAEAGRVGVVMGAMEGGVGAIGGVVARQSVRTV